MRCHFNDTSQQLRKSNHVILAILNGKSSFIRMRFFFIKNDYDDDYFSSTLGIYEFID